jgi:hypothetical protein
VVVKESLVVGIKTDNGVGDFTVHIFNRQPHPLASVARTSVAQFDGFVSTGARSARNCCSTARPRNQSHLHLSGGVTARIEDLSSSHFGNGAHGKPPE